MTLATVVGLLLLLLAAVLATKEVDARKSQKGITSTKNIGRNIGSLDGGLGTSTKTRGNVITGPGTDTVLFGTPKDDVIFTGQGNVIAYGIGGDDIIYAGGGTDKLYGGTGNDILNAGFGDDLLDGGPGDDVLQGNVGNGGVLELGGSGNDKLIAGFANSVLVGGSGANLFDCGTGGGATHPVVLDYNPAKGDSIAGNCKVVNTVSNVNSGNLAHIEGDDNPG